jgi:hypothetical protein
MDEKPDEQEGQEEERGEEVDHVGKVEMDLGGVKARIPCCLFGLFCQLLLQLLLRDS